MNQTVPSLAAKGVFIDNNWRLAVSGRTLPMVAPAEGAAFAAYYGGAAIYGVERAGAALMHEEAFGPILAAMPFRGEAEAVQLANSTDYGLVAGVWSADGARAMRVARKVRAGRFSSTAMARAAASNCHSAA